ncbi:MAG TPA: hypothetical protein DDW36_00035, partial [Candidatus Magasanikbacteria bacterium]|nr:hypothetical protein [Candidatus Magasanikbacteria bacterium]
MALAAVVCVVGCGDVEVRGGNKTPPAASGGAPRLVSDPAELSSRSRILYRPGAPRASKADELPGIVGILPTIEPEPEPSPSPSPEPECRTDDDCGVGGGCGCVQDDLGDQYWACTGFTGHCVANNCVRNGHGELCPHGCGDDDRGCYECTDNTHCDDNNPCTQDSCGVLGVCYHETEFWDKLPCSGDGSTCEEGVCTEPMCSLFDECHFEHRICRNEVCDGEECQTQERIFACACSACPAAEEDHCDWGLCASQPTRVVPDVVNYADLDDEYLTTQRIRLVSGVYGAQVTGFEIIVGEAWRALDYDRVTLTLIQAGTAQVIIP